MLGWDGTFPSNRGNLRSIGLLQWWYICEPAAAFSMCYDDVKMNSDIKQDATNIYRVVKQGRLAAMNCRCIGSEKICVHTFEQFDSGLKTNNVGATDTLYQSNTESNIQSSQHCHTGFIHLLRLYTFGYICQHIPPSLLNFQWKMNLNEVGTTSAPTTRKQIPHHPCAVCAAPCCAMDGWKRPVERRGLVWMIFRCSSCRQRIVEVRKYLIGFLLEVGIPLHKPCPYSFFW